MSYWYKLKQEDAWGNYEYSEELGLSKWLFVEADTTFDALSRMEGIGANMNPEDPMGKDIPFWEYPEVMNRVDPSEVPEPEAKIVQDDNGPNPFTQNFKVMGEDQYDAFVHPIGDYGTHYGAWKELHHIKRRVTGYGLIFSSYYVSEVMGVGRDGWAPDVSKGFFPAPEAKLNMFVDRYVTGNHHFRMAHAPDRDTYTVWCRDREPLEEIKERVESYIQSIPPFDLQGILGHPNYEVTLGEDVIPEGRKP